MTMNLKTLTTHLISIAKSGHIDVDEVRTIEDLRNACRFSAHFRETIEGFEENVAMDAVAKARAESPRTLRRNMGLWLSNAEYAAR
jgi:hypothetical protein